MIKSAWLLVGLVTEQTDLAPAIVQGFERVQQISVLGVTLTYNLTMTTHIDNIITSCARVLYGLRTLRSHGMPPPALHTVFQSTVLAKVTYTSPACWGFTNAGSESSRGLYPPSS